MIVPYEFKKDVQILAKEVDVEPKEIHIQILKENGIVVQAKVD